MTDKTFNVADLARAMNIDPKRARARLRKSMKAEKGKRAPNVLNGDNKPVAHTFNAAWTFPAKDRDRVARMIATDEQYARHKAKTARAKPAPTPEPETV